MSIAVVDASVTERGSRPLKADAQDEAPNAKPIPSEREAQKLVRTYQGMVAWPSVALGFGIVVSFAAVCWLGALGVIPLWLGLILNTAILYASQTRSSGLVSCCRPRFEATHRNRVQAEPNWAGNRPRNRRRGCAVNGGTRDACQ